MGLLVHSWFSNRKIRKANFMTLEGDKVLVRGASGGVGSLAVMMLNELGYKVASTGNKKLQIN